MQIALFKIGETFVEVTAGRGWTDPNRIPKEHRPGPCGVLLLRKMEMTEHHGITPPQEIHFGGLENLKTLYKAIGEAIALSEEGKPID